MIVLTDPLLVLPTRSSNAENATEARRWGGLDFADSCLGDLLSRRDASDFVPKGLDDRSQAIYCLEYAQKRRTVPEGRCELGYTTYSPPMVEERPVDRIIPFPTGRVLCVAHSRQ
jgi:hypothetical protein